MLPGVALMRARSARDTEASLFYFARGLRKLRLAGLSGRDEPMLALKQLAEQAEAQADELRRPRQPRSSTENVGGAALGAGARSHSQPANVVDGEDAACAIA